MIEILRKDTEKIFENPSDNFIDHASTFHVFSKNDKYRSTRKTYFLEVTLLVLGDLMRIKLFKTMQVKF